jgi:hypothetical protein
VAATDRLTLNMAYAYTKTGYNNWDNFTTIQTLPPR